MSQIKAKTFCGMPKVDLKGNIEEIQVLLACAMNTVAKHMMIKEGCSYEVAINFVKSLPDHIPHELTKDNIIFSNL